jgi:hypothetical protein
VNLPLVDLIVGLATGVAGWVEVDELEVVFAVVEELPVDVVLAALEASPKSELPSCGGVIESTAPMLPTVPAVINKNLFTFSYNPALAIAPCSDLRHP